MATDVKTPYDSAKRLISSTALPTWLNDYDALRLASYQLYEDIYWSEPGTFKLQQRGTEENPIYVPSGRIITNTMDRYTGRDWSAVIDPAYGQEAEQLLLLNAMKDLFKRERMASQYESNKLYGLMRGDWCFYITGNPLKPEGSRLRIQSLDPREYFPIEAPDDVTRVIGCDIIEQTRVPGSDDLVIKRIRYLKSDHPDHPSGGVAPGGPISYQVDYLVLEDWEDPDEAKYVAGPDTAPPVLLPPQITQLPVYHIKNIDEPGNPFGSSEMRGLERIMAAVNQSITDEELALAMDGLGMYKSDKGQPRDPVSGVPVPWQLGPGRVVHDATFDRVTGVSSVTPFTEHVKYLEDRMNEVHGSSDVARGKVDVSVAESGIALKLKLSPILDASSKKDKMIREVMDQMLYDLRAWLAAYEGINAPEARVISAFGEKMPRDIDAEFNRLLSLVSNDPPLITMGYFRDACRELGINIPVTETGEAIAAERAQFAAAADPEGARLAAEGGDAETVV